MTIPARGLPPTGRVGPAIGRVSWPVGGVLSSPAATARADGEPARTVAGTDRPGLGALSMRDEEIVLLCRAGQLPHDIATALGHDLLDVMRALNRAIVLGLWITPHHAARPHSSRRDACPLI